MKKKKTSRKNNVHTKEKKLKRKIPKRPRKPRSKKPSITKMYFTKETEDAIVKYNNLEDENLKEDIFNQEIKYPFEKLVENIFNTFKFSYLETGPMEAQKETVSHLVMNINKFDPTMGFKAYSYFSIVAKNYLIALNNNNYKRFNQHIDISEEREENTVQLQSEDKHHKDSENSEFIDLMVKYWEKNIKKIFPKQKDFIIADAIIELFRNSDGIDTFNKKALYLYIREMSSCNTQCITRIIKTMKKYQSQIRKSYIEDGVVEIE